MDILTPEERSKLMRLVKSKDTKPEMRVRRGLFALGLRYRLHDNNLPGKPDIVFKKYKIAVFVHGCFWHRHIGCKKNRTPKTNTVFWEKKFAANVSRDKIVLSQYEKLGWTVFVIWECETENELSLRSALLKVKAAIDFKK